MTAVMSTSLNVVRLAAGGEDVVLGEAAVLAGAADLGRIDAELEDEAADGGREGEVAPLPFLIVADLDILAGAVGVDRGGGQAAPASIRAITAPTATVSPSLTSCSPIVPATGDGTSTATLSVSRLAIGSSAFTPSPRFFRHLPRVAL